MRPLFVRRAAATGARPIAFRINGRPAEAWAGDTILTAVLTQESRLRWSEFGDGARAGFCLMGACQDCTVQLADGTRVRACSTPVEAGMDVLTDWPEAVPAAADVPQGETA